MTQGEGRLQPSVAASLNSGIAPVAVLNKASASKSGPG